MIYKVHKKYDGIENMFLKGREINSLTLDLNEFINFQIVGSSLNINNTCAVIFNNEDYLLNFMDDIIFSSIWVYNLDEQEQENEVEYTTFDEIANKYKNFENFESVGENDEDKDFVNYK